MCHVDGVVSSTGTIDLLIADMPEDLPVPGLTMVIPEWNSIGNMYNQVFRFASRHLDDDGALLLLTTIGTIDSEEFVELHKKYGFDIFIDWACLQNLPLTHPNYRTKQVCASVPIFQRLLQSRLKVLQFWPFVTEQLLLLDYLSVL
jgi:hypothetical protein